MSGQIEASTALVALGANMPFGVLEGPALLGAALAGINGAGLRVLSQSGVWRTEAWPAGSGQPDYFNAVVQLGVGPMSPTDLYGELEIIERRFGRERRERWAARTLDLDILTMDRYVGEFGGVILPHPRMTERAFVLAPLTEVAPNWRHAQTGLRAAALLGALPVQSRYERVGDIPAP